MPTATLTDQIADHLRKQISSGDLRPGTAIPSETDLREEWNASRGTVRSAVRKLEEEGLVMSRHGRGSFVRRQRSLFRLSTSRYQRGPGTQPPVMAEVESSNAVSNIKYDTAQVRAPREIAERLQISEGDPVSRTHYTFFADGEPVQSSVQWEPLHLVRGTPVEIPEEGELGKQGVIARYDSIGLYVTHVHESIASRMPTPEEDRLLDIPPGVPLFAITRTHWANTTAVETADIVVPADRYRIEHTEAVALENQA